MKKVFITIILLFMSVAYLLVMDVNGFVYAEESVESVCDRIFFDTVNAFATDSNGETITAKKTQLYNIDIKPVALLYDFYIGGKEGYCVIGNENGKYVPFEIYPEGKNPYENTIGLPIYLAQTLYADYRDDGLYYIEGIGVKKEIILETIDVYYGVDYGFLITSTNVNYVSKTTNEHINAKRIPSYNDMGYTSACAPLAAANIIAYFDRYATELLPNYTPGFGIGQDYLYKGQNDTIKELFSTLYNKMGTTASGTTSKQFIAGLNAYCSGKGYSVSYENIQSGGTLNYSDAQSALRAKKALVLFETSFSISAISDWGNYATYEIMSGTANHVMAAFGYQEITYRYYDGSSSTERYLVTATGIKKMENAYLNVDVNLALNEAYAIEIA